MFTLLVFVVAVSIAGCAAFFSVKGIGLLFAGSFISVVIMASSLEAGKLVAASFLYRKWKDLAMWLRIYLTTAVLLLMGITSLGIFGFLTDAYEQTKTKVDLYESNIARLEDESSVVKNEIENLKSSNEMTREEKSKSIDNYRGIYDNFVQQQQARIDQINTRLAALDKELSDLQNSPGGIFSSKKKKLQELNERQKPERDSIAIQLQSIDAAISDEYKKFLAKVDSITVSTGEVDIQSKLDPLYAKLKNNEQSIMKSKIDISETDIGSFKFIARAFDIDTDTAVKWFTLIIVLVFDPLAVSLIIGYNALLKPAGGIPAAEKIPVVAKMTAAMRRKLGLSPRMRQES
tara:strand:- start:107 stop:1147 length:1041 start_codon:yes stop_codon:yes gene_type:complete